MQNGVFALMMPQMTLRELFDGIRHQDITDALLQKGVHPEVICALLRGSFGLQGKISLFGALLSSGFEYARGQR